MHYSSVLHTSLSVHVARLICVYFAVLPGFHIGDAGAGYRYPPVNGYAGGYYMAPDSMDIKMDPEVMEMYHQHQNHHATQTPSPMGGYPSPGSAEYPDYGKTSMQEAILIYLSNSS